MYVNPIIKEVVTKIVLPIRGVKPTFNEYHVLKTLLILYEKGPLGRQLLSKHLGISVTSVRTLVNRLRRMNLIEIDSVAGCILTPYGQAFVEKLLKLVNFGGDVTSILEKSLLLYNKAYCFLLRNGFALLKRFDVSYLRDTLIRYKAKAAIIAYILGDKVYIPPYEDLNENVFPSLRKLRDILGGKNFDAIITVFAENERIAEEAFFLTLLELNIL
jgi:DNA-binding MarR family transcriptional regulator